VGEGSLNALQIFNKQHPAETKAIAADTVCLGYGFLPSNQLAIQTGCDHLISPGDGILLPRVDENLESSLPGFFIAGDCLGMAGKNAAEWSGRLAALEVASSLGYPCDQTRKNDAKKKLAVETNFWNLTRTKFLDSPGKLSELPDDTILCRCEDITVKDVRQAVRQGADSANSIKQITRAGMGRCQGRQCGILITRLVAELLEVDQSDVGRFTTGAPIFPVRLEQLIQNKSGLSPVADRVP
jgi:D-hydroxyproline dehydrogenase subunit alpha